MQALDRNIPRGVEEVAPDSNEYGGFLRATQCVERVVESPVENVVEWTQQANQQVVGFFKTPQTLSLTGFNGFKSPNRRGSFRPRLLPFQHCVIKDNTARIRFPWKEPALRFPKCPSPRRLGQRGTEKKRVETTGS